VYDRSRASTLYDAVRAGELPTAQAINAELKPLLEFIVAGGLATTSKAGLELLGVGVGNPRPPLLTLEDGGRVALKKLLTDAWRRRPVANAVSPVRVLPESILYEREEKIIAKRMSLLFFSTTRAPVIYDWPTVSPPANALVVTSI
jgi:hypothetical protein